MSGPWRGLADRGRDAEAVITVVNMAAVDPDQRKMLPLGMKVEDQFIKVLGYLFPDRAVSAAAGCCGHLFHQGNVHLRATFRTAYLAVFGAAGRLQYAEQRQRRHRELVRRSHCRRPRDNPIGSATRRSWQPRSRVAHPGGRAWAGEAM